MSKSWNKKLFRGLACAVFLLASSDGQVVAQQPSPAKKINRTAGQKNMRLVGHSDLQNRSAYDVTVKQALDGRWIAYVGHHSGNELNSLTGATESNGVTILDVTDPRKPTILKHIPSDPETDSRMVRVCDRTVGDAAKTYLLRDQNRPGNTNRSHEVWDVTDSKKPIRVSVPAANLRNTHKNWWDCASGIAYLVGTRQEFNSNHLIVVDLSDPSSPKDIVDYHLPGQNRIGTKDTVASLHGPIVIPERNRAYLAYGAGNGPGAAVILDLAKLLDRDPSTDPLIGRMDFPSHFGAHTTLPYFKMKAPDTTPGFGDVRDLLVIADEAGNAQFSCKEIRPFMLVLDITEETKPYPIANFKVPGDRFCARGGRFGSHGLDEGTNHGTLAILAYFNAGVRVIELADPFNPKEMGFFIPPATDQTKVTGCDPKKTPGLCSAIQTNNVFRDPRGFVYITDRARTGLHILEFSGALKGR
ncbi:MAG: LVIVD repeat-containing protein [Candidatus Binatia bacterium]